MPGLPGVCRDESLLLPDDAPRIRITAGVGTASQKSWNLRRPVTLIGSERHASIVLRNPEVEPAHCVIVNTGSAVLLKDLHTAVGTVCNGERIDLAVLEDGDLVRVGETCIQVAIRTFRRAPRGAESPVPEPLRLSERVRLRASDGVAGWTLQDNCAVLGSRPEVEVHIEAAQVAPAHAVVFTLNDQPAVCNVAGVGRLRLEGTPVELARLYDEARLELGTCCVTVSSLGVAAGAARPAHPAVDGLTLGAIAGSDLLAESLALETEESALNEIRAQLDALRQDIGASWRKVNDWQGDELSPRPDPGSAGSDEAQPDAEFDHRDAVLRGRLHDLTAYQEELAAQEADLRGQRAAVERERETLARRARALDERERALQARELRMAMQSRSPRPVVVAAAGGV